VEGDDLSYIGQPVKRLEDHRLVAGRGSYVDDIKLPGMLFAAILRSPHAHAHIRAVDVTAAQALPGVAAVFTERDLADAVTDIPTRDMGDRVNEMNAPLHPVLARGRVNYVGQPVAVVVASDRYLARDAIDLINVEYEPLPPIVDPYQAIKSDAVPIHEHIGSNVGLRIYREGGDVESAFAHAEHIVIERFEVQRLAPVPMETRGVVADYQPQGDLLTVWDSTQTPHRVRNELAGILHHPVEGMRVIAPDVGGGFGEKGGPFPEEVVIAHIARSLAKPVKWIADREENMMTFHARGHTVEIEAAAKRDGTVLGMRIRIITDLGAYFISGTPSIPALASQRIAGPYSIPAMRVEVLGAITNKSTTGPYRGAGGPESAFALERTMDLIARDLDLDPAEVRIRNLIPPEAFPYDTPTGLTYDSGDYLRALERALELSGYAEWRRKAREWPNFKEPLIGVGLATVVKQAGVYGESRTESAQIKISSTGQITAFTGVSPHGQGTETIYAQVVADVLGVTPAAVQVLHGDTAIFPVGGGTNAGRGCTVGASAVYLAAQKAREELCQIAGHLLECPASDILLQEGSALNRHHPERRLSFSEIAAVHNREMLPEVGPELQFDVRYTLPASTYGFAAHVAIVAVDRDTGHVRILKYVAVHDCGKMLNPMLVAGQVHGAMAQGIGQALTEGVVYNADGQILNASLMDYAVPFAADLPDFVLDSIETLSPTNPLGVKGVGELPTVASPAAVANAVMDALASCGVRHIDTPLSPEKVWRALQGLPYTPGFENGE
jgi:carbon-monoxide dehydrogenase large subunit